MNILLALLPAIGWGIQPLILTKIGGKPVNQIVGTGIGALLVAVIVQVGFSPPPISRTVFFISLASGAFWVIGQAGQYHSLKIIGVAKTMPITTGLQLVGTSLISVIAFKEWPGIQNKLFGLGAIILLIVGATLTATTDNKFANQSLKKGVLILVSTSIGYWIYSALPRIVDASGLAIFFPQMLGVFIGAVVYALKQSPKTLITKKSWETSIIGLTFSLSALAYIFSAQANGVATAFIISQLSVVVSTLGSLVILKEKKTTHELTYTLIGLALIVVGSTITVFI